MSVRLGALVGLILLATACTAVGDPGWQRRQLGRLPSDVRNARLDVGHPTGRRVLLRRITLAGC